MREEDSERESGKTERRGGEGGLKGVEMTEEAGLHGRGLDLGGDYPARLGPHELLELCVLPYLKNQTEYMICYMMIHSELMNLGFEEAVAQAKWKSHQLSSFNGKSRLINYESQRGQYRRQQHIM